MRPTKTAHSFEVAGQQVKFTSNFDSGNLRTVTQVGIHEFLIESALDSYEIPVSLKSFFHFKVENYPPDTQIILNIQNLSLLSCIKPERRHRYKPCYSFNGSDYTRFQKQEIEIIENNSILNLRIKYAMVKPVVYFAFSLPYSYERYLNMIRDLPDSSEDFYLKKEVLCYSKNLNLVYMVTITSFDRQTKDSDQIGSSTNGVILPERHLNEERVYFDKPVILLSARVHPGESPSSWAIQGIIKFLVGGSPEAVALRKYFLIVVVPMLNPDGVYEGMYRLDTLGHNLNRYYLISDNRQPSIYSMKHLIKHYNASKRLLFYFDFHGHPSFKGSFMYGNAIDEIAYQAQTELFGRIMSLKCLTFEQKYCIFDREQMSSKDRYDMYTKEGCARVYAFKTANILHSYTIEMGFHACTAFSNNPQKPSDDFQYDQESYYQEGITVMKSVLEVSGLAPSSQIKKIQLRRQIATEILIREQRFKKQDKNVAIKKKNVNEIIENQYWKPIRTKFFNISTFTSHKKVRKLSKDSHRKSVNKTTTYISSELIPHESQDKKIDNEQDMEKQSQDPSLKIMEENDEKSIELFLMKARKKNIETKEMMFTMKNRRFSLNPSVKNSKSAKVKSVLDHILPKSIQNKFETTKRKDIRIMSEKQEPKQPSFIVKKEQMPEEIMFGDMGLREDLPTKKSIRIKESKAGYSFISASNFKSKGEDIKQIFNEQIPQTQLSHRKAAKAQKKYFKFFQLE